MKKISVFILLSLVLALAIISCTPEMAEKIAAGIPSVDSIDPNKDAGLFDITAEGAVSLKSNATVPDSLLIPQKVGDIEVKSVIAPCTGTFTSVTIPGNVKTIGSYAFMACTNLKTITIESGVNSIGDGAFIGCNALTMVVINSANINIHQQAFPAGTYECWYLFQSYEDIAAIRSHIASVTQ